jgi:hypothetical protein
VDSDFYGGSSVADTDPAPVPFWPGFRIRDGKKLDSGSRINIPDHVSKSLEKNFWSKNSYIRWCWFGIRNLFDPEWKNSDPGSGMFIRNTGRKYLKFFLWWKLFLFVICYEPWCLCLFFGRRL